MILLYPNSFYFHNFNCINIHELWHQSIRKNKGKEILKQNEKSDDYDVLLSRKEVAKLLKVSLVTINKYKREGKLPYRRLGRNLYFKKGDILKALEIPVKYQRKLNTY